MRVETRSVGVPRPANIGCGAAFATGLAVFLVIALLSALFFVLSPGDNNVSASYLRAQPQALRWVPGERVTALLLGTSGADKQSQRVTAITIASLDPSTHTVRMLSVTPDLWVTIPGYGSGRLADAYVDGGPRLALVVLESVVHIPIPYYAVVGTDTFSQIVDSLGGITLPVNAPPSGRTSSPRRTRYQRVNGDDALAYLSAAKASSDGGADRLWREQTVLRAVTRQAFLPQAFFRIPSIVNAIGGSIQTNVPFDQLQSLAGALNAVPASRIHGTILDEQNGAMARYQSGGTVVFLPDWQRIKFIARHALNSGPISVRGGVEVLNGNGGVGQASALADWLRQAHVQIHGDDSAASFTYPRTEVVLNNARIPQAKSAARSVAALLQVPLVVGHVWNYRVPVVVLIGHDFQDPTQQ